MSITLGSKALSYRVRTPSPAGLHTSCTGTIGLTGTEFYFHAAPSLLPDMFIMEHFRAVKPFVSLPLPVGIKYFMEAKKENKKFVPTFPVVRRPASCPPAREHERFYSFLTQICIFSTE